MTIFSGYREHMEPLSERLEQTGVLVRMPRRRRLTPYQRALLDYAFGAALILALMLLGGWLDGGLATGG